MHRLGKEIKIGREIYIIHSCNCINVSACVICIYETHRSICFRNIKKEQFVTHPSCYYYRLLKVEEEDTEKDVTINIKKVNKKKALR